MANGLRFFVFFGIVAILPGAAWGDDAFSFRQLQPILTQHCLECHGPQKQKGGLRLDSAANFLKGGADGPIALAKKSQGSLLIDHLRGTNGKDRMPPKGQPLDEAIIKKIATWIDAGLPGLESKDEDTKTTTAKLWSMQPMKPVNLPRAGPGTIVRNPIDLFVQAELSKKGLSQRPEADRRTLIRRLYFDLWGLPPLPAEVDEFVNDRRADAYEHLIEKLLASPRYGERWARHWLDVAHYADSHGHDQDRPRANAWPYRDYVIRSFNEDKPYAQFVQEQLAGDALWPGNAQAIIATGFLAAGPWDESGLRDIREDAPDRIIARNLDRDDIVTSVMSTFTGLTVGCARCHDHKFDPITQGEYYSLQAIFSGIDKAERSFDRDPVNELNRRAYEAQLSQLRGPKAKELALPPERLAKVDQYLQELKQLKLPWAPITIERLRSQYGATLSTLEDGSVLSSGLKPERDTYRLHFTSPLKKITAIQSELLCDDSLPHRGPGRQDNGNLHLSEVNLALLAQGPVNRATPIKLAQAVADYDQPGWTVQHSIDGKIPTAWGIYPQVGQAHRAIFILEQPIEVAANQSLQLDLHQLHGQSHLIGRFRIQVSDREQSLSSSPDLLQWPTLKYDPERITPAQRHELSRELWEKDLKAALAKLPPQEKVYCGTNQFAPDGSFKPALKPRPIQVLKRGEVTKPLGEALPGTMKAIAIPYDLPGPKADQEAARRIAFAQWLTHRDHPYTWRVLVNRVWHYHFGRGIVDTPNDFGFMGGKPSHPDLLDWLALGFRDNGGSIKDLHRLILASATYRQACTHDDRSAQVDGDNRLLWRGVRQRLDAEAYRDTLVYLAGKHDATMYGPPIMHFTMKPGIHVTPVAEYERYDFNASSAGRRSIYRFLFRTSPDTAYDVLDCPDPSQSAPVRGFSVSAIQSLVLWNNRFALHYAQAIAKRAATEATDLPGQVRWLTRQLLLREPTERERPKWEKFAQEHGLDNLARVLFNSNEMMFID